jgi:pilus assembly protein Flp/PilA
MPITSDRVVLSNNCGCDDSRGRLEAGEAQPMKSLRQSLTNLMTEDGGQDLIEYALVSALVGLCINAAASNLSNSVGVALNGVGNSLATAAP